MIEALDAVGALTPRAVAPVDPGASDMTTRFASILGSSVDSLRQAEQTAMQGLQGKAATAEVVQSILEAERSFHATLAIRDKLVSAWQDISRMAI